MKLNSMHMVGGSVALKSCHAFWKLASNHAKYMSNALLPRLSESAAHTLWFFPTATLSNKHPFLKNMSKEKSGR